MHKFKASILNQTHKQAYLVIPHALIRLVDAKPAALYAWFLDLHALHETAGANGWFYQTDEQIRKHFNWKQDAMKSAVSVLVAKNLIQTQRLGVGGLTHYRILESQEALSIFSPEAPKPETENPKSETPKSENQIWENPKTGFGKIPKQDLGKSQNRIWENPKTDLGKSQVSFGKIPKQDLGKSQTNKSISNNKENNKENKNIEIEANLKNSLPTPQVAVSKKTKIIANVEAITEGCNLLIKKYYPNQSKGWGDLLINYLINVKAKKSKCKDTTFTKKCLEETNDLLQYCIASNFPDMTIEAYLKRATEGKDGTGWFGLTHTGYCETINSVHSECLLKLKRGVIPTQADARNTNELISLFVDTILTPYSKIGAVRGSQDPEVVKQKHLEYFELIKSKLNADPAKFQEQLVWVADCLKVEKRALEAKTTNTYKPKAMAFADWIEKSYWEYSAPSAIKAPKIAPIAPQVPKVEPIQQPAQKAAISENKQPLRVAPAVLEDTDAMFPEFNIWVERVFLPSLFNVSQVRNGKIQNLADILRQNGVDSADNFVLFLYDVCKGFPSEAENPTCWDILRTKWNKELAKLVLQPQAI